MVKLLAAVLIQLLGLGAVAVGLWWLAPWLALVVSGGLAVLMGLALERRTERQEEETDARSTVPA
jgi:membrane protein implicated in regulation of membrane protease activity